MVSFRGKKKEGPCPGWSPLGVLNSKFLTGIPSPFIWESPRALFTNIHCLDLEQAFETLLEEMKLSTDVLDQTFTLQLEFVFFQAYSCLREYNHAVLCQSWVNQSWVNLLFSVPRDLILHPILNSFFPILDSQFVQESRIVNCVENQKLNGTETV